MKRVLVVPWSIAPAYCAMCGPSPGSRLEGDVEEDACDDAADERADHGDPRVLPVRVALAGDRQDEVRDPRAEVARRVDRVAGRSAERHADAHDEQRDHEDDQPAVHETGIRAERE